MRTAAEFEREERALFDSAVSRATMLVTLSYPEFDARGERNLPSLYLEDLVLAPRCRAPCARRRASRAPRAPAQDPRARSARPAAREDRPPLAHGAGNLPAVPVPVLRRSALCASKRRPPRPEERLDFLTQGNIVHAVLADCGTHPRISPRSSSASSRATWKKSASRDGYHTERLRNAMLDDLQRLRRRRPVAARRFASQTEEPFEFPLEEGLRISGKIDRLDVARGRPRLRHRLQVQRRAAHQRDRLKTENLLQAPLYLMAAESVFGARPPACSTSA